MPYRLLLVKFCVSGDFQLVVAKPELSIFMHQHFDQTNRGCSAAFARSIPPVLSLAWHNIKPAANAVHSDYVYTVFNELFFSAIRAILLRQRPEERRVGKGR